MRDNDLNNIDRILRVVYRGQDLQQLFAAVPPGAFCLWQQNTQAGARWLNTCAAAYLRLYPHNESPDEARMLMEHTGDCLRRRFGSGNTAYLFALIAEQSLVMRSNSPVLDFDKLLEWDGLVNKVHAGIFYAAFYAQSGKKNCAVPVLRHDNELLYRLLASGYAENHMHLYGSGYTGEMNWAEFLMQPPFSTRSFEKLRLEQPMDKGQLLCWQKVRAVRLYLEGLERLEAGVEPAAGDEPVSQREITAILRVHHEGGLAPFARKLQRAHTRLVRSFGHMEPLPMALRHMQWEQDFLYRMFKRLLAGRLTGFDLYLFNCYLCALSQFWFLFVQDNEGMGFAKFERPQANKKVFLRRRNGEEIDCAIIRTVFDKYYREGGVRALEMRVAPMPRGEMLRLLKRLEQVNDEVYSELCAAVPKGRLQPVKIRWSVVVHYIKDSARQPAGKGRYRKQAFREGLERQANWLGSIFTGHDPDGWKGRIVGVDAANCELRCPPELFAPVFRRHRQEASSVHRLRYTYHVGEDFPTLAGGLRAIDEAVVFLGLQRGDRLGHASALGHDVEEYFRVKRGQIVTTLQDYVDDLAWMYMLVSSGMPEQHGVLEWLAAAWRNAAVELYQNVPLPGSCGACPALPDYISAWRLRGDHPRVYDVREEINPANMQAVYRRFRQTRRWWLDSSATGHRDVFLNPVTRALNRLYQYSGTQYQNGAASRTWEASAGYVEAVALCRRLLIDKVYRLDIAIETNPSSNRKISSARKFIKLPLLAFSQHGLRQPSDTGAGKQASKAPPPCHDLPVCVNSDDSAVFQTNLANEYALVAAALVREGYDRREVMEYIEHLRQASLLLSFVPDVTV